MRNLLNGCCANVKHTGILTLCTLGNFYDDLVVCDFFKVYLFKQIFREHYQSVEQFGPRSVLTFCKTWSGSKLFENIISGRQWSLICWHAKILHINKPIPLFSLRYLDLSENGISGLPVASLWRSKVVKELIFNRNNISVVSSVRPTH